MPPDFDRYRVQEGEDVNLAQHDSADTASYDNPEEARDELTGLVAQIADLQARLYAEERHSLLVVLQGIDAAGKDSTVKHVFSGTNPQGVRVYSLQGAVRRRGRPTTSSGAIHAAHPGSGHDPRLQPLPLRGRARRARASSSWRRSAGGRATSSINDFERILARDGTTILKFFLHISKDAQLDRFRERLEREDKHCKFSANDIRERRNWDAYQRPTWTRCAPRAPSGHRGTSSPQTTSGSATSRSGAIVASTLQQLDPRWPPSEEDLERFAAEELDQLPSSR